MPALPSSRRTVLMLAICQALAMTGASIVGTTGAIVGSMLTPDKALSTLPIAVQMTGMMTATIPAAFLMARSAGARGSGPAPRSARSARRSRLRRSSRRVSCCSAPAPSLLGIHNGFSQQYRFAAAEIADEAFRSKAISLVLAGGVVSAVFGPETAIWSRDLFAPVLFAGCYAMIVVLCLAAAVLLYFVELPNRRPYRCCAQRGRPLAEIAAQPAFIAAALAAMVGYGVMSLVMTATPIAMLDCGHEFAAAAFVIQWHSLGMYAPSFVTGHLIARFGLVRILLTGAALLLACCADQPGGARDGQFLGRQCRARDRLEFPVHRRHDPADPLLYRRGKGQGPGAQRFSGVRHGRDVVFRLGRAAVRRRLGHGADRDHAVCRGGRGRGLLAALRTPRTAPAIRLGCKGQCHSCRETGFWHGAPRPEQAFAQVRACRRAFLSASM